jgi:hypothetical protein
LQGTLSPSYKNHVAVRSCSVARSSFGHLQTTVFREYKLSHRLQELESLVQPITKTSFLSFVNFSAFYCLNENGGSIVISAQLGGGGLNCPGICVRKHIFGFSIKRKMDNTKEIGKTYHGLKSTYNALKPIHDKSVSTMVRATMVSMQHGLIEVRNSVLIGLPYALQQFPILPTRKRAHTSAQLNTLSHRPHDGPELQEAVKVCSAGFASPLSKPHIAFSKSFGTVVQDLW